jgi:hypothetical protein
MPETCGCQAAPRRHCDICYAEERVFLACSRACLDTHQLTHGALTSATQRAKALLAQINARHPDSSAAFASHRERLMTLVANAFADARAGAHDKSAHDETVPALRLLVLGVGNASDLDLPFLTGQFREVHLADLDGAALARAKARQPEAVQARLVLHPDLDLSGLLAHLDDWGDAFPEPQMLGATAIAAARALVAELGTFDVTLSTCVLSQLGLPFRRSWVASASTWANLSAALSAVHIATLAGCAGRRGILAFDVQPQDGAVTPEPEAVLAQLCSPGLARLVANARLTDPWYWNLGDVEQLVYAVEFERAV